MNIKFIIEIYHLMFCSQLDESTNLKIILKSLSNMRQFHDTFKLFFMCYTFYINLEHVMNVLILQNIYRSIILQSAGGTKLKT